MTASRQKLTMQEVALDGGYSGDPMFFQARQLIRTTFATDIVHDDPDTQTLYVARHGLAVAGAARVEHNFDCRPYRSGLITVVGSLAVVPELRWHNGVGHGVGRSIMAHIAQRAAAVGDERVELIAGSGSEAFYQAIGYRLEDDQMVLEVQNLTAERPAPDTIQHI